MSFKESARKSAEHSDPSYVQDDYAALMFDPAIYYHYLEGMDLSEKQKRNLLEAMWAMAIGFVDIGFGQSTLQQAADAKVKS